MKQVVSLNSFCVKQTLFSSSFSIQIVCSMLRSFSKVRSIRFLCDVFRSFYFIEKTFFIVACVAHTVCVSHHCGSDALCVLSRFQSCAVRINSMHINSCGVANKKIQKQRQWQWQLFRRSQETIKRKTYQPKTGFLYYNGKNSSRSFPMRDTKSEIHFRHCFIYWQRMRINVMEFFDPLKGINRSALLRSSYFPKKYACQRRKNPLYNLLRIISIVEIKNLTILYVPVRTLNSSSTTDFQQVRSLWSRKRKEREKKNLLDISFFDFEKWVDLSKYIRWFVDSGDLAIRSKRKNPRINWCRG